MAKLSKPFQGHVLQLIEFPGSKPHSPSGGRGSLSTSNRRTSNMSQALFQVLSAFAVDMNFLFTSADTGLTEGHFFYLPLEGTFIPSLISHVGTQWFAWLHRDASWHLQDCSTFPVNFHASCPPMTKGKANLPMKVTALLETHSGNWLVPYPLPFLSAHIQSHLHGDDSTAWQDIDSLQGFWAGVSQTITYF